MIQAKENTLSQGFLGSGGLLSKFGAHWRLYLSIHVAVTALVVAVLSPLSALLLRLAVSMSGDPALSDQDILFHLLSPVGLIAFLVIVSLISIIVFLEYAALVTAGWLAEKDAEPGVMAVLVFLAGRAGRLFGLALLLLVRVLLYSLPFIAMLGAVYWVLLTDYDINYYLAVAPREWYTALALAGLVVLAWVMMMLYLFSGWIFSLPLLLLGSQGPAQAIAGSVEACKGHRKDVLFAVLRWFLLMVVLGLAASVLVALASWVLVPSDHGSIGRLLLSLVVVSGFGFLESFLLSFVGATLLSLLILDLFRAFALWRMVDHGLDIRVTSRAKRLGRVLVVGGLAGAVLLAAGTMRAVVNTLQFDTEPHVVAHRGASGHYPENTLAAVRGAIDAGAQWVEIDVQETADGEVVVIHDSDLKKVGGVPLVVGRSTLKELGYTDIGSWFDLSFSDERIPTLREVLALCKDRIGINIELKYYGHEKRLEQSVADIVAEMGMDDQVVAMSLSLPGVRRMKQIRPDWEVGLLSSVAVGDISRLDVDFLALNAQFTSRALVRRLHKRGRKVMVWTVNDALGIATVAGRGVDAIITDEPALAVELMEQRRELEPSERFLLAMADLFDRPQMVREQ